MRIPAKIPQPRRGSRLGAEGEIMRVIFAAVLLAAIVTGCSDSGPDAEPAPTVQVNTTTPASDRSTPEPVTTPLPQEEVSLYGKGYAAAYYQCADRLWSSRVAQWNALSQAERDRTTSEKWSKSKGWPVTHEATLDAASTRKVCPS